MESKLDLIEKEGGDWQKTLKEFYVKFENDIRLALRNLHGLKNDMKQETEHKCEKCGANMILKISSKGKFLACPNYPTCKNTKSVNISGAEIEVLQDKQLDEKCPDCGSNLLLKTGRFGKFITCSNYPKCVFKKKIDIGIPCPNENCTGMLIKRLIKKGKSKGKNFYGCSNYPKCNFTEWHEIVIKPCPKCDNKYLIVTSQTKEKIKIACPKQDCGYKEETSVEETQTTENQE